MEEGSISKKLNGDCPLTKRNPSHLTIESHEAYDDFAAGSSGYMAKLV